MVHMDIYYESPADEKLDAYEKEQPAVYRSCMQVIEKIQNGELQEHAYRGRDNDLIYRTNVYVPGRQGFWVIVWYKDGYNPIDAVIADIIPIETN